MRDNPAAASVVPASVPVPVRDAATLIIFHEGSVLMGQRSVNAAFMPGKFVFPGGAVDPQDHHTRFAKPLNPVCAARLSFDSTCPPDALAAAALRELNEETGHRLAMDTKTLPLFFVFRAITPPGNARRFDTRFFVSDAACLLGDPDNFTPHEDELSALQWVPVDRLHAVDMAPITRIALQNARQNAVPPLKVPFFKDGSDSDHGHYIA